MQPTRKQLNRKQCTHPTTMTLCQKYKSNNNPRHTKCSPKLGEFITTLPQQVSSINILNPNFLHFRNKSATLIQVI
jgi:hypothetical protein